MLTAGGIAAGIARSLAILHTCVQGRIHSWASKKERSAIARPRQGIEHGAFGSRSLTFTPAPTAPGTEQYRHRKVRRVSLPVDRIKQLSTYTTIVFNYDLNQKSLKIFHKHNCKSTEMKHTCSEIQLDNFICILFLSVT